MSRARAGGEDQPIPGDGLAAGEVKLLVRQVESIYPTIQAYGNPVVAIELLRLHIHRIEGCVTPQVLLGEGWTVRGQVRFLGKDRDIPSSSRLTSTYGYEPYVDPAGDVRLHNCPFHALARDHRDLVCGMNLELTEGVVQGLGLQQVRAVLEPRPNECCVAFRVDEGNPSTAPLP